MSQIPQLMSGRALEHGIALAVDHGGTSSAKMYVGGQAKADVAAGTTTSDGVSHAEVETSELSIPANALVAGSTIRVRFVVKVTNQNSTPNISARLRFGTNTTASSNEEICASAASSGACATNDIVTADLIIQIRTATTAVAFGSISVFDQSQVSAPLSFFKSEFTVACASEQFLTVTTDFGAAHANNLARTEAFIVDIVNPQT